MTTITIERAMLEQAKDAFAKVIEWDARRDYLIPYKVRDPVHAVQKKIDAALSAPATAPEQPERKPMTSDQLADVFNYRSGFTTRETYTAFARAIEAFHSIKELAPAGSELPTNSADQVEVTSTGQVPAWHDAPTCAGLWFCDEGDENPYRFTCHNVSIPLNPHLVGEGERWYGPIPPDGDKP